jgi:hypothetical protein
MLTLSFLHDYEILFSICKVDSIENSSSPFRASRVPAGVVGKDEYDCSFARSILFSLFLLSISLL